MNWSEIAEELLSYTTELFTVDPPTIVYVSAGPPAYDYCTQLTVHVLSSTTASGVQATGSKCGEYPIITFQVTLTRCAPTPDNNSDPPQPDELNTSGLAAFDDLETLMTGLMQGRMAGTLFGARATACEDVRLTAFQTNPPSGGLVSTTANIELKIR